MQHREGSRSNGMRVKPDSLNLPRSCPSRNRSGLLQLAYTRRCSGLPTGSVRAASRGQGRFAASLHDELRSSWTSWPSQQSVRYRVAPGEQCSGCTATWHATLRTSLHVDTNSSSGTANWASATIEPLTGPASAGPSIPPRARRGASVQQPHATRRHSAITAVCSPANLSPVSSRIPLTPPPLSAEPHRPEGTCTRHTAGIMSRCYPTTNGILSDAVAGAVV